MSVDSEPHVAAPYAPPGRRIGHPRPARAGEPFLLGSEEIFPLVTGPAPAGGDGPTPYTFGDARPVRRRLPGFVAGLAFFAVLVVVGQMAWQVDRLTRRLEATQEVLKLQSQVAAQRTTALEAADATAFNPETVAAAVLPSVYRVRAGGLSGTAFAIGDGIAATDDLVTNFHVVESVWEDGDREVTLERGKERITARIVAVDRAVDVAQLRVAEKVPGLPVAVENVRPGQQVLVVGSPLGLEETVTTGVVSALRGGADDEPPTLQFDAPINPGNSGGPVVNASRQVVGIATAKARDAEGIGLAIPIATACGQVDVC